MVQFSIASGATLALLFSSVIALPWNFKFKPGPVNEPPFPKLIVPTGTGIYPTAPPTGTAPVPTGTAPVPTGTAAFLSKRDFKPHGVFPTGTAAPFPTGWSESPEHGSPAKEGPQFGGVRKNNFKPHWQNGPHHAEPQGPTATGTAPYPGPTA